jgi:hypothetical protein
MFHLRPFAFICGQKNIKAFSRLSMLFGILLSAGKRRPDEAQRNLGDKGFRPRITQMNANVIYN